MREATPSGCRLSRSTLTGGCSSSGAAPAIRSGTSALCATRFQWRSTASAGKGSCPLSTRSTARRAEASGGIVQRALPVHRRIAGRHQQRIALAQRHFEPLGEPQHHLAAGLRAAGFDVAQVAGRDLGLVRQVELAQPAVLAPVAQMGAEGVGRRWGGVLWWSSWLAILVKRRAAAMTSQVIDPAAAAPE